MRFKVQRLYRQSITDRKNTGNTISTKECNFGEHCDVRDQKRSNCNDG